MSKCKSYGLAIATVVAILAWGLPFQLNAQVGHSSRGGSGGVTGWPTTSTSKEITWANSLANAVRLGDGATPVCIYTSATLGPQVRPCTDANTTTLIATNKTWSLFDEELNDAGTGLMETVDPDAASTLLMWQYPSATYRPKKTVWFGAGALSTDGTQCAAPAEVTINSGPKLWSIICTDNDSSRMHGSMVTPDEWDAGTVTFTLTYVQTAADTNAFKWTVAAQCRGDGEALSTWGTEINVTDATLSGSSKNDTSTSTAVTPTGTCAAGDFLAFYIDVDATGTTTAMATLNIIGVKMEYSVTSRSS